MRTLKQARKEKRYNQKVLAALVGIHQESLSLLERGLSKPTQATKEKFERVLGQKIDWIETQQSIIIRDPNYLEAESLVQKLVEVTAAMPRREKRAIKQLIIKYLN